MCCIRVCPFPMCIIILCNELCMASGVAFSQQYGTDSIDGVTAQLSVDMEEVIVQEATEAGMFPVSGRSTRHSCSTTSWNSLTYGCLLVERVLFSELLCRNSYRHQVVGCLLIDDNCIVVRIVSSGSRLVTFHLNVLVSPLCVYILVRLLDHFLCVIYCTP